MMNSFVEEKETPVKAKIVKSTISNEPVKKKMLFTKVNLESRGRLAGPSPSYHPVWRRQN